MKTGFIIAIIIIILLAGSITFYQTTRKSDALDKNSMTEKSAETGMQKNDQNIPPELTAEEAKRLADARVQSQPLAGSTTPYYEFHPTLYSKALAEKKIILLYFYADWCPICKKEQTDATLPAFNELQKSNVVGFRVHYNDGKAAAEEIELAKKYGITYQHTKIILKDGKQVSKDLNSWNKEKYLAEFSQY